MVFPICPLVMSNKAKEVGDRGVWKKHEKIEKKIKMRKADWNLELWTDIKWVRFGRTELSISGSDAEFWDLSFEMGPKLSGSHPDGKKGGRTVWKTSFFKFLTFFCHQVGRIKVLWALVKCIRRRILRSFICNGSWGPILSSAVSYTHLTLPTKA